MTIINYLIIVSVVATIFDITVVNIGFILIYLNCVVYQVQYYYGHCENNKHIQILFIRVQKSLNKNEAIFCSINKH